MKLYESTLTVELVSEHSFNDAELEAGLQVVQHELTAAAEIIERRLKTTLGPKVKTVCVDGDFA